MLLVLDNCEHLVEACAGLVDAAANARALRILATSREATGRRRRAVLRTLSLRVRSRQEGGPRRALRFEAVQLFVERARLQQQGFELTRTAAPAIAELCLRLDGMPLALELAAARIRMLPVEKIVERLNDRFRLLTGGVRTALPRQQTLRATITWSFELLSEAARTLFARLSVFVGGFSLEAAEGVAAGDGLSEHDVLDLLSGLIGKSLVLVEGGGGRYRLLETIREFARERLLAAGEEAAVRERHANWYLRLAERVEPSLVGGPQQKLALDLLEADHENVRLAIAWSLGAQERADVALRLCGALYRFWSRRGYWHEGYRACMKALAAGTARRQGGARKGAGHRRQHRQQRSRSRESRPPGRCARAQPRGRRPQDGGDCAQQPRESARLECRHVRGPGPCWSRRGRSISELGNSTLELHNMSNLVNVLRRQRDAAGALALAQQGLATSRSSGDRWLEAIFLHALGRVALDRGDVADARRFNEQALGIARELDMPDWQSFALVKLAFLAVVGDDYAAARRHLIAAVDISRDSAGASTFRSASARRACSRRTPGITIRRRDWWGVAEALLGSLSSSDVLDRELIDPYRKIPGSAR